MHNEGKMLFSFAIFPVGAGDDVSGPVSEAIRQIADSGLDYQVTGSCTLIEGTWNEVMPVIERCVHQLTEGHPRVYANISIDHHRGAAGRLAGSIADVEKALDTEVRSAP